MKQAESGAPLQPGATQPEHDGAAHETKKDCNEFTMQGAAQNLRALAEMTTGKLYSHSELTTLLERMARLVVEEATLHRLLPGEFTKWYCSCGYKLHAIGSNSAIDAWQSHVRDYVLAQLQRLREAVERG